MDAKFPRARRPHRFMTLTSAPSRAVALVFFTCACAASARAHLAPDEDAQPVLKTARIARELSSRAARLGASSVVTDTIYVGFTPGHAADNWWSIWSGSSKTGVYHRPPARGGMWDFEPPYGDVRGDSLQGWWSYRNQMTGTGGLVIPDYNRPWRAIDYGNNANYVFGSGKKTLGVVGVWHVDSGNTVVPPASTNWTGETDGGVKWAPLTGGASAWMGLRRHGDNTYVDPITHNPFGEDVLAFNFNGSVSGGGTDKKFPGYGAQMDQMLYRDIDVSGAADTSLTVSFQYQTTMSTGFGTSPTTRSGWFVHDPLTVITGTPNANFISNQSTVPNPPVDSLMAYVGAPAEGSVTLSDGNSHTIYDPLRRWFGEVIRSNEGLYKELASIGGTNPTTTATVTVPSSVLGPIKMAGGNVVRLVFRVKTNQAFDDENGPVSGFSSDGRGAAIVDEVKVAKGAAGALTTIGSFESPTDIDNTAPALEKWRSTGKPPQPFHHVHPLAGDPSRPDYGALLYQDICGQPGNSFRTCDMLGIVVSAGDHDNNEASSASHSFGTAEEEPFQGIFSPVINLAGQGYAVGPDGPINNIGLTSSAATPTNDYFVDYELYTGIFDFFNQGNSWRFGFQSYPGANSATGVGEHKRWGNVRFPGAIFFNPDKRCFRDLEPARGFGVLRTTNLSGVPDSCRIYLGTRQEAYRFGIPQSEFLGGAYWDNISLDIVDGPDQLPLSVDIWHWTQDTFPANDAATPGMPAAFDTTTALIKTGLNIAPTTGNTNRFDVPGDTTVVIAEGDSVRVDLVFRILPGPGNYVNAALGINSQLKAVSSSTTPIPPPAPGVANFWSNYMFNNGAHGSPGGHPTATSGPLAGQKIWSAQVWNSARCDTAEVNVFNLQKRSVIQPAGPGLWMTAYHETELADPHRGVLGIAHNVCFVADTAVSLPVTTVICGSGNVPAGVVYPPVWTGAPGSGFNGVTTTKEGTKIIPDGLLTPGAHVEYFFRREDLGTGAVSMCPDTTLVYPQSCEGSLDGHRWQEFGVLPDRWKSSAYTHPVLGTTGRGDACMLYVDQDDRRGNERVWVGVADSIGATRSEKYGAHNGWHAPGDGDVNDPANFVRKHIGMPGTTWDMLGVKASESLNTNTGSIGSRGGASALSRSDPSNSQIDGKSSRIGPSEAMLNTYYKIMLMLTGDLNSGIFGPFTNKSQNDLKIMQDFLLSGSTTTPDRGFFGEGDGLVEDTNFGAGATFLTNYLGVGLINPSYLNETGNFAFSIDVIPTAIIDPTLRDICGLRNACTFTLDVLNPVGLGQAASYYEPYTPSNPNAPVYVSGVYKPRVLGGTPSPWISLVDGWNITNFHGSPDEYADRGRLTYMYNVFFNVFSSICDVQGAPTITTDTPGNNDGRLFNFMSLANNPMRTGSATVDFGLARAERVKIQIFDVSGRLVRTLADRSFTAGEHKLTWDGADNAGREVARGVYFVRSQHAASKFTGESKLVVLK